MSHFSRILSTERLYLRRLVLSDLAFLTRLHQDPEVMRHIGPVSSREEVSKRLLKILKDYESHPGLGVWMACILETGDRIGWACLKDLDGTENIEVGYRLTQQHWGHGYATELCRSLLHYGFTEKELSVICGITRVENIASRRVLEKCGLKFQRIAHYYHSDVLFFELHWLEYEKIGLKS
ncbi:MAG: GNAT family N-acetyltransferase [Saprospiraceae bacterium]|nr:GNAT family N-acetyltransferase [Saprospiraceae bacterium]